MAELTDVTLVVSAIDRMCKVVSAVPGMQKVGNQHDLCSSALSDMA